MESYTSQSFTASSLKDFVLNVSLGHPFFFFFFGVKKNKIKNSVQLCCHVTTADPLIPTLSLVKHL